MRTLLVLLSLLPFSALDGCVSDASADEALDNEGLHDATYGGPAVFSCGHGDHFSRTFLAHRTVLDRAGHPVEQEVSGVICCGFFTCVVRVD